VNWSCAWQVEKFILFGLNFTDISIFKYRETVMTALEGKTKITAIVAVTVLVVGAVAAAVMTGVIPHSSSGTPPEVSTASVPAPAPAVAPEPLRKHVAGKAHAPVAKASIAEATPPPPPPACTNCGVVEGIESFTEKGPASGGGAVAGGVLGAIVGHQIGQGRGKELATVAGAVGGALAGNAIEKNVNKVTRYHVSVRMNDGSQQMFTLNSAPGVAMGDHVVIVNGAPVRQ
jgi:outer membrane lipoprotein SlyB